MTYDPLRYRVRALRALASAGIPTETKGEMSLAARMALGMVPIGRSGGSGKHAAATRRAVVEALTSREVARVVRGEHGRKILVPC